MVSLSEFLSPRYRTLKRALEETRRQLASIEDEIRQIESAAAAANIKIDDSAGADQKKITPASADENAPRTMKDAAIEALRGATGGMTTVDILEIVNDKLGTIYPRSSLSPQLSRLKGDGIIYRKDGRWILTHDPNLPDAS
ncbi:hypothetical protein [Mesorhizobium sp. M0047]|uniref:hypothetical protein n=1 Tax=Mesorhizobium sp. M0047 TaxID=2956859 RepID=UPI003334AC25